MRYLIWILGISLFTQQTLALTNDQNRATGNRSETFQVDKDGRLDLNTRAGDIIISTWNRNEAVVTVQGIPPNIESDLRIRYDGGILRVDYDPRFSPWSRNRGKGLRFKIDLPEDFGLDLRTGGGDIEVVGNLKGDVKSHTSGGDVTMRDIGGEVELTTSGGDIRVGTIGGDVHLQTSGGDIRVEKASSDLDVQTSGGDIRIGRVGGSLEAQTSGGDIAIAFVGGKARIRTSGGDIEIDELSANARITTAGGDIELQNAKGVIQAKTSGGELELLNVTGAIDARTAGGDVLAEITPEGSKGSSLISAGGDIVLYVDPKARVNIEARIHVDKRFGGLVDLSDNTFHTGVYTVADLPEIPEIPTTDSDLSISDIDEEKLKEIIEKLTQGVNQAIALTAEEAKQILQELQQELRTAEHALQAIQQNADANQTTPTVRSSALPAQNNARRTMRYRIRSSFEAERYEEDAEEGEISATYMLNGGGTRIWLETSDGNIEIRELKN